MLYPDNIANYCSMMEQMATDHKLLLHGVEESKGQDQAYAEIWVSSDPYSKVDYSSFLGKIKSTIKYPVLINLGISFDRKGSQGGAKKGDARFAILMKSSSRNEQDDTRKTCYEQTESIAESIVARLREYFENNLQSGYMDDVVTTEPIGPISLDGKLYGVVVNFDFTAKKGCIYDETEWNTTIEEISE
jgi:hypothetical protein